MASAGFVLLVFAMAIAPGLLAPFDFDRQDILMRNEAPMTPAKEGGIPHILGTDALGRDVLSRLISSARISLAVGLASVVVSGVLGTALGLVAGYYRGRVDDVVMRAVDVQMGFPSLLLALVILYAAGSGFLNVVLVLAITRWMVYARVTRGLVLSLRSAPFVEAARAIGCT
ncbi:MAG TPA: ABC transporter permease, partial [Chloroflexota bacterium]